MTLTPHQPSDHSAGRQPSNHKGHWHVDVDADTRTISQTLSDIHQNLMHFGYPENTLNSLRVVLAELMNNIAEHAYSEQRTGHIELDIESHGNAFRCKLIDQGRAMPGLSLPSGHDYDFEQMAIEDLPEGGFGWGLIHMLTTDLSYLRDDGKNRTSFQIDFVS